QGSYVPAVKRRSQVGPDLSHAIDRLMATGQMVRPAKAADVAGELRAIATAGGLGDPAGELAAYFVDPGQVVKAKVPTVVSAIVTNAERAVAEQKLPRAMALADRASALAPDDPAVTALVQTVTEGGKASRRRRVLAVGGVGVLALGGAALGVLHLIQHEPAVMRDATIARVIDAAPVGAIDAGLDDGPNVAEMS